jgi:hypothetical protein
METGLECLLESHSDLFKFWLALDEYYLVLVDEGTLYDYQYE